VLHRTVGDDGGRQGTAENIGKQRKTAENSGRRRGTTGDDGGRRGMVGDGGGQHNVVRPGPGLLLVGQVQKVTGRDDTMSSVLVLCSNLSRKFWKRRDGTTKCRPSSSCPVANTEIDSLKSHKSFIRNNGYRKLNVSGEALDGIGEPGVNG